MTWQAPPGWPAPPEGWSPMPGWQPDPSWPEPPADWVYWKQAPRSRWQWAGLGLLIGVPVLVFALLMAAQIHYDGIGCGSVDPTDEGNYSRITVLNDTAGTVVIDDCPGVYCNLDSLPVRLAPGTRYKDDAACGASGADMTSWRVRTVDGQVLGYIAVETPRKHDGLLFPVSHASRDRRTPTQPSSG